MASFKRPTHLLAAGLVFFALTSAALAQQIKEIKFEGQDDQDAATKLALAWMGDKTKHGPSYVRAMRINSRQDMIEYPTASRAGAQSEFAFFSRSARRD
jgi:hypothetical protein